MPKQVAASVKEAIWKVERPCKIWREDVEYNENKSREAVVRVLRGLRNIALEATGCTKLLRLRGEGIRITIAGNLVRLFKF
jgi:predicted PP-loop superfamily ATPase